MADVKCSRCGNLKAGLDEAPLPNELGAKVLAHSCTECWQAWVGQQLMLMNEYHLDPMNDEHSNFLDQEMIKFLMLN